MSRALPMVPLLLALVTVSAAAQKVVVLNKQDATAQIFDVASGRTLATLPTGDGPHEVAISPDGKLAVAADYGGQGGPGTTLTVFDLTTLKVARTVKFGTHVRPHGITFLRDNRTVVVTAEAEALIVSVDVVSGEVKGTKRTGSSQGHMVVMSPDEKTAYVANIRAGNLSIIDYAGNAEPVVVPVGTMTEAINLTPDGKLVWMGSNNTGKVYVVDVAQKKVIDSVQTKGFPYRIAFTPDSRTALVTNPDVDEIQVIDVATRAIRSSIAVKVDGVGRTQPFGIAMVPGGRTAWVSLAAGGRIAEIDLGTGKVLRVWNAGNVPDGIGYGAK